MGERRSRDGPPTSPVSESAVADEFAFLVEILGTIADFRQRKWRHHPLPGVLELVVPSLMATCRSLSAISRSGQIHPEILPPLGLLRSPSVPTLSRVLAGVDPASVRAALLTVTQALLRGTCPLWPTPAPLTARAEWVAAYPTTILAVLGPTRL